MRIEHDSLGDRTIPTEALHGIHTQRARENFGAAGPHVRPELIRAMVRVKKACALAHLELGALPEDVGGAIVAACDEVLAGAHGDAFATAALQGGAGTSTNMNVNEVLANLAILHLGGRPGDYARVHPLDHVNRGQSTNDVYPTALRVAAIQRVRELADALARLQDALQRKEEAFAKIRKLGRTQLMDAAPITLGEEFGAYAQAIARDRWRIYKAEERLRQINLGGTAVGTGAAADPRYAFRVIEILRDLTGLGLARAEYPMDPTQNQDVLVEVSGLLCDAVIRFREKCIETLEADSVACARHLEASSALALLLVPELGYDAAAALAGESLATGKSIRQLVVERKLLPPERVARLFPEVRP